MKIEAWKKHTWNRCIIWSWIRETRGQITKVKPGQIIAGSCKIQKAKWIPFSTKCWTSSFLQACNSLQETDNGNASYFAKVLLNYTIIQQLKSWWPRNWPGKLRNSFYGNPTGIGQKGCNKRRNSITWYVRLLPPPVGIKTKTSQPLIVALMTSLWLRRKEWFPNTFLLLSWKLAAVSKQLWWLVMQI